MGCAVPSICCEDDGRRAGRDTQLLNVEQDKLDEAPDFDESVTAG